MKMKKGYCYEFLKRKVDSIELMHESCKVLEEERRKRVKMEEEGALVMKRGLEMDNRRRLVQARVDTILNRDKLFKIGKSKEFVDQVCPLDDFLLGAEDVDHEKLLQDLL